MNTIKKIEAFKQRTKHLALDNVMLFQKMPQKDGFRVMGRRLLRSATSVWQTIGQLVGQIRSRVF